MNGESESTPRQPLVNGDISETPLTKPGIKIVLYRNSELLIVSNYRELLTCVHANLKSYFIVFFKVL